MVAVCFSRYRLRGESGDVANTFRIPKLENEASLPFVVYLGLRTMISAAMGLGMLAE